ncbi:cytochrome-c oxidase [Bacillus sp. V3B]|uniref:cytochrome-c oxidase n=1 Tax=Bacillus sp. V3B TaxID=2804915 RepID=UPI0021093E0A|nr:cytochrome-c oxidase [Bacillus sp. V3B]MCQ6276137.1 cytochrome-c oxidase [Bacillus sp. V3B]
MGVRFIKISVIYFAIGVCLGLYMSIAHDYALTSVHTHINLLGWVSLALVGMIYALFPTLASTKLAKTHFWLHNISLPIMMIGLSFIMYGQSALTPVVAASGTVFVLAIILFTINILKNLKSK